MTLIVPVQRITVVVQKWEESERNWGTRPDGFSVHLSEADRLAYITAYWDSLPSEVPDEYSRPHGTPYLAEIAPGEEANFLKELAGKKGLRYNGNNYPGDGGSDGWKPVR